MSPACPIPARQPFANFPLMLFAAEGDVPVPLTSAEGWERGWCSNEGWRLLHRVI